MNTRILPPKSVVVIGEKDDAHLPYVERHLSLPLIVIDLATITTNEELSYTLDKGKLCVFHNHQILDNIAGVWFREWRDLHSLELSIQPPYEEYAKSAITRHTQALYSHLEGARWVSDFYAMQRASYKPLQLKVAARLGFKVPATLFTSDPARAKQFIDNHTETITKPLGKTRIDREKDSSLLFFATKIHRNEKINLSGLPLAPAIFQQAIDAAADLRVTVIGEKIFSAIIVDEKIDPSSSIRDWRIGHLRGKIRIESYKLPKDIANKCIALVKELGLKFGAIDLVLDKKGAVWFIENNTRGQWGFGEDATGQPMGKAMADLLQGNGG